MSKKQTTALLLALGVSLSAVSAHAGGPTYYLAPPARYDHPYKGDLTVMVVGDQASVRRMCYDVTFEPEVGAVACSRFNDSYTWCDIFIADGATLKQTGWPRSLIMRHEIAHCNGWGADHEGALPWQEWAEMSPAMKPGPDAYAACAELAEYTNRKERVTWERCLAKEQEKGRAAQQANPFANLAWDKIIGEAVQKACGDPKTYSKHRADCDALPNPPHPPAPARPRPLSEILFGR